MSQSKAIFDYLMTGQTLDNQKAYKLFNMFCLSQRVSDLRLIYGIPVQSCLINLPNGKRFSSYWLERDYIAKVKAGEIESVWGANLATP